MAERAADVFLSLGSNLGDREAHLKEALRRLGFILGQIKTSSIYESAPLYVTEQPAFLNAVIQGRARISERRLLERTQEIERAEGRLILNKESKGPRPLDIDILLFGDLVLKEHDLVIPHPCIKERKFVLLPLLELAPEILEPGSGVRYALFMDEVNDQTVVFYKKWQTA